MILELGSGQEYVWNGIAVAYKVKHLQCEPTILILSIYFKRNEYICPYKDLYVNVYSSFFLISLKLETDKNDQQMLRPLGENLGIEYLPGLSFLYVFHVYHSFHVD